MLLRDIVDLEATQGGPKVDNSEHSVSGSGPGGGPGGPGGGLGGEPGAEPGAEPAFEAPAEELDEDVEGEGQGMSLSALEEKLKPEVLATFEEIESLYKKLHKMQGEAPRSHDLRRRGRRALGEGIREVA